MISTPRRRQVEMLERSCSSNSSGKKLSVPKSHSSPPVPGLFAGLRKNARRYLSNIGSRTKRIWKHLGEIASVNPGALFLLDSYHACCAPLGLEEAASSFDGPARQLAEALAPHKATLAMIHHTNKSVSGGNATNASRGSNALPAAASLTILMNWFKQPAEGQTQSDHRVVLKTQGRAKGTTLLIELQDDGWIHHEENKHNEYIHF